MANGLTKYRKVIDLVHKGFNHEARELAAEIPGVHLKALAFLLVDQNQINAHDHKTGNLPVGWLMQNG